MIDSSQLLDRSGLGEDGRPLDKAYLEAGLLDWLLESVAAMQKAWDRLDAGEEYHFWDCDYCNLQADINRAENGNEITADQAWHLREKYLGIERPASWMR